MHHGGTSTARTPKHVSTVAYAPYIRRRTRPHVSRGRGAFVCCHVGHFDEDVLRFQRRSLFEGQVNIGSNPGRSHCGRMNILLHLRLRRVLQLEAVGVIAIGEPGGGIDVRRRREHLLHRRERSHRLRGRRWRRRRHARCCRQSSWRRVRTRSAATSSSKDCEEEEWDENTRSHQNLPPLQYCPCAGGSKDPPLRPPKRPGVGGPAEGAATHKPQDARQLSGVSNSPSEA